jgi:hypothetical protein
LRGEFCCADRLLGQFGLMRSLRGFALGSASSALFQHGFPFPATLGARGIIWPGRCAEFPQHRPFCGRSGVLALPKVRQPAMPSLHGCTGRSPRQHGYLMQQIASRLQLVEYKVLTKDTPSNTTRIVCYGNTTTQKEAIHGYEAEGNKWTEQASCLDQRKRS